MYFSCHIISLLGILGQPYAFSKVFDALQNNEPTMIQQICFWLGIYICLFLVFNIFHRIGRYIEQRIAFRARQKFINDTYDEILNLPMSWHNDNHSGNTINRIKTASDALYTFGEKQYLYIEYFMMFWGPLIALSLLSYKISLLAFSIAIVIIYIIEKFDKIIVPLFKEETETQHQFLATFFDYISNIKTIITLRLSHKTKQELNKKIEVAYPILTKSITKNQYKWAAVSFCILMLEVGVIFYYIYLKKQVNAPIMIGAVVAIFQYLQQLSKMFFNIAASFQEIVQMQTDFKSVEPIEEAYYYHSKQAIFPDNREALASWGKIKITNLSFTHKDSYRNSLKNINLEFSSHSKIAIVGESGSGKSTLLSLLRGLYKGDIESLTVDEKHYNDLSVLSSITTLILQEPEIFENTIEYNIAIEMKTDKNQIEEAIKTACLEKVVENLPKGLKTDIREKGVNLSGGERQRLALARGLLAATESSIILLDEPTSSVDIHNEIIIYEGILSKFKDKCIISSIHRLHLLNRFNLVYVMSNGEIVQKGTFNELRQQKGPFSALWNKYIEEQNENIIEKIEEVISEVTSS